MNILYSIIYKIFLHFLSLAAGVLNSHVCSIFVTAHLNIVSKPPYNFVIIVIKMQKYPASCLPRYLNVNAV